MPHPHSLKERLRRDIIRIREPNDRTPPIAEKDFRWEGIETNPMGWRTMGDLADDLEELLNSLYEATTS